jgi:O-antigen ligase
MTLARPDSLQKQNPLLYWATMLYIVGAPNFIHFDETGRTHTQGLFNLTSISGIFIAFLSGYVLVLIVILGRRPLLCRKVKFAPWLWGVLLLQLMLATALQPVSHLTPPAKSDIFISVFRMAEWILAFTLFLALYSRTPADRATELIVQLIGRASWIWIAMTWMILPIMPSHVYGGAGEGEAVSAHAQLGGELISPSYLATLAIAAFFYSLIFFPRGLMKFAGCSIAVVTIALARTRIEQLSFLMLLVIYVLFYSGKFVLRLATIVSVAVLGVIGILFREAIFQYISRGQSLNTLTTLDDRTRVWQASLDAARLRPFLGYGFVVGAKNAIRDHWLFTHWTPPHAHNEFIQALVSGGILAVVLVSCIYGRALWTGLRIAHRGPNQVFLFLMFIHFTVRSIGGPNLTVPYTRVGAVFLLTFIGIVADPKKTFQWKPEKMSIPSTYSVPQEIGA